MGKPIKRKCDNNYDSYIDEKEDVQSGKTGPSITDFVSAHKVEVFANTYAYTSNERDADEVFDECRLRSYFQAYPRPLGDPLVIYLELLSARGFKMINGISGYPVICVCYKCLDTF